MKKTRSEMAGDGRDRGDNPSEFSGCWILTESQEFLRRTFAFLPAKTLGICCRVCKAWQAEVKRVLHLREEIGWATFGRLEADAGNSLNTRDPLGQFGVHLNACLDTLGSLPRLVVMFSECHSTENFQGFQNSEDESDSDEDTFTLGTTRSNLYPPLGVIRSRLPVGTSVVYVHTDGTMGCQADLTPAGESEGALGTSCILLPRMEGVTIDYQLHRPANLGQLKVEEYTKALTMPADTKCVLTIYGGHLGRSCFDQCLQREFYTKFGTMPVIAGGIATEVLIDQQSNDHPHREADSRRGPSCLTVTFSGPKVKAASVVLDYSICTRDGARKKILELKKAGLSEKRSLAFLFSCVGRGGHFYQEEDVESGVLHEVFPNTPQLGFFGGGEYGCDNLTCGEVVRDNEEETAGIRGMRKAQNKLQALDKTYTCVICLLSFS